MTTTTFADRMSVQERMIEHLRTHRAELTAHGLNVDYWIQKIQMGLDAVRAADARQEALKAELHASTASLDAVDHEAYVWASGGMDATIGAWGKDSKQARTLAQMRSKLHRPDATPEESAVAPAGQPVTPVEAPRA